MQVAQEAGFPVNQCAVAVERQPFKECEVEHGGLSVAPVGTAEYPTLWDLVRFQNGCGSGSAGLQARVKTPAQFLALGSGPEGPHYSYQRIYQSWNRNNGSQRLWQARAHPLAPKRLYSRIPRTTKVMKTYM